MCGTLHSITLYADGSVSIRGFETGNLTVVKKTADIVVLKERGSNYWAARGVTKYFPATYQVYKVDSEATRERYGGSYDCRADYSQEVVAHLVIDFPARSK